jgi:hypothetical protein
VGCLLVPGLRYRAERSGARDTAWIGECSPSYKTSGGPRPSVYRRRFKGGFGNCEKAMIAVKKLL